MVTRNGHSTGIERAAHVAGSLGASFELGVKEPIRGTYEELLGRDIEDWVSFPHRRRPEQGYFPLDER